MSEIHRRSAPDIFLAHYGCQKLVDAPHSYVISIMYIHCQSILMFLVLLPS